ncbi:hypothetical protein RHO14_09030 [Orbus wheelerorum]
MTGELRLLYDKGINPKTHFTCISNSELTLNYCLDYWMERYVSRLREKTAALYNAVVYKSLFNQFNEISVQEIPVRDWVKYFDEQERLNPKKARVIFVQAKSAINWCIGRQVIESCELMKINPKTLGLKKRWVIVLLLIKN